MNNDRFRFRVWDNDKKKYIQDEVDVYMDEEGYLIELKYGYGGQYSINMHHDDFIIEQCIGLSDKIGKLIFGGDVLGIGNYDNPIEIGWNDACCFFECLFLNCGETSRISQLDVPLEAHEIIGNIHKEEHA